MRNVVCLAAVALPVVALAVPQRVWVKAGTPLTAVRDGIRRMPAAARADGVEVVLAAGEYVLPDGMELTAEDGGASAERPVVWRAERVGAVRIVGARSIPAASFCRVTDPAVLERLPPEGRDKVVCADVSEFLPPGKMPEYAHQFPGVLPAPVVFFGEEFGVCARWPNTGWTTFSNRVDRGTLFDPKQGNVFRNGAFVYDNPRARRWDFAQGVWFNGYWTHDWDNRSAKGGSYGAENGTNDVLRLDADLPYGVMSKKSWGEAERRFYAFNLLEELDAPGEWWLDRTAKTLYVVPSAAGLSAQGGVCLAGSTRSVLRGQGVRNVRFEGIAFERNYETLVSFRKCEGIEFRNCRFAHVAWNGIELGGSRNAVRDSEVFDCGVHGIVISGGDRKTLTRADSVVENCRIHHFAVLRRTYAVGISPTGVGITMRGNEIYDAPHTAILYQGNEFLIEGNDIHHVLLETGDAGAVYTGRDWTTQGNVLRNNFVHELGALGTLANTMGFYFDDCDCGDEVYGNVFWRVSRGIMIGGGRQHPVHDNVFAECRVGLSIDTRGMEWPEWNQKGTSWDLEGKAKALGYTEEPWKSRYPLLAKIMDDFPREPRYNPITDNVFYDCTKSIVELGYRRVNEVIPKMGFTNNLVLVSSPKVVSAQPDSRIAGGFIVLP